VARYGFWLHNFDAYLAAWWWNPEGVMNRHLLTMTLALCCAGSPSSYSEDFRTICGQTVTASTCVGAIPYWADGTAEIYGPHGQDVGPISKNTTLAGVSSQVVADFNGDRKSDVLWRNKDSGDVYLQLMDGRSVASGAMAYREPDPGWSIVTMGDFNKDGVTDLIWRHAYGQVYYMPFGSNGLPTAGGEIIWVEPDPAWLIVHAPDLDGDGRSDLLWWHAETGQVYAMLIDGATISAQGLVYSEPDTRWKIVGVGDFAGVGKQNQLVWRHATTGEVYLMTVSYSNGVFSQFGEMIYREPDTNWKIVGAADFNGDGKTDIVWRHAVDGRVHVMLMNGGAIASQGTVYTEPNVNWKIVAQGDYDGDGKADLLWRNEATGEVYLMLLNGLQIVDQAMIYVEPWPRWKILGPWEFGQAMDAFEPTNCSGSVPQFTYSNESKDVSIPKGDYAAFRLGSVPQSAQAGITVYGQNTVFTPSTLQSEMVISESCGSFDVDTRCRFSGPTSSNYDYVQGSVSDPKWCPLIPGREYFVNVRHVVDGVDSCPSDRCSQRLLYFGP
jgi:hypothetical protein